MNSKNIKTSDRYRLLKNSDNYDTLSNVSICYTQKNTKKSYKNNKFKMFAPTWNEELKLPD